MQDVLTFLSNHTNLSISIVILIVLLLLVEFLRAKRKSSSITPAELIQYINHKNAVIFDIRVNEAYRKGHIIGAQSLQPKEINENSKKLEKFKTRPIIIVCSTGIEAQKVAALLLKQDYNAFALAGGMRAWVEAAMPIVKD